MLISFTSRAVRRLLLAFTTVGALQISITNAQQVPAALMQDAVRVAHAQHAALLAVSAAGSSLVAVGAHGVILSSDDQGQHWRQASSVPFDGLLTGVSFVDAEYGWVVGHRGVILATKDGGAHWSLQRHVSDVDRPLLAVQFFDRKHGVAVGLWSLVLTTEDGGTTWSEQTLPPSPGANRGDLNLLSLFVDGAGAVYTTAEHGMVLKSDDRGHTWRYLATGYAGSLWSGVALDDGTLIVGGLRGALYRSADGGLNWSAVASTSQAAISGLSAGHGATGNVMAVGLDGAILVSRDRGRSFTPAAKSATGLTAIHVLNDGHGVTTGREGPSRF